MWVYYSHIHRAESPSLHQSQCLLDDAAVARRCHALMRADHFDVTEPSALYLHGLVHLARGGDGGRR